MYKLRNLKGTSRNYNIVFMLFTQSEILAFYLKFLGPPFKYDFDVNIVILPYRNNPLLTFYDVRIAQTVLKYAHNCV